MRTGGGESATASPLGSQKREKMKFAKTITFITAASLAVGCTETLDEPEIDWYSDGLDTDGDGIPNPYDNCPLEREDPHHDDDWYFYYHSYEDANDGCPAIDNDGDRIDDNTLDACPNDPECWTDSCLVGMISFNALGCESHICYRGECIRNDTRYSCNYSIGSDMDQNALWELLYGRDNERGRQLVTACEMRLEQNWEESISAPGD
jgi:hypothetical protein